MPRSMKITRSHERNNTQPSAWKELICLILCITSAPLVLFYCIAFQDFETSLTAAARSMYSEGPIQFFSTRTPRPNRESVQGYAAWIALQAVLYICLPGPIVYGPTTPGGRNLEYKLNGLAAWAATVLLAVLAAFLGLLDPAALAKNWGALVSTSNIFSVVVAIVFQIKARLAPDNKKETFFTGSIFYNFFEGGELHPRIGRFWDWRHFLSTRTGGILAWTLIDLSFGAYQLQKHGYVSNSMVVSIFFRGLVVVDFFVNESWFLHTLDGMYESFAFYNIYGFSAMMPVLWTLQTQYLVTRPTKVSRRTLIASIVIFMIAWLLRFSVDAQKNKVRESRGECSIWGRKAQVIKAPYQTRDRKNHQSLLLCSGWWGIARHMNYVGSVVYTWASCAVCGRGGLFPYTEAVIITGFVIHRCFRDEEKCAAKYGKAWDEYCRRVPWRMIPGIF